MTEMNPLSKKRAFALVLVLIVLMLVTTMAVLFLAGAARERRGVDLYARGSQVRNLAATVVTHVMGEINAATKEGTADVPVSWASQPGMIRTFGSDGSAKWVYKLYSWDETVSLASRFKPTDASQVPPATWKTDVAIFNDLNKPINDVYPIVDPRVMGAVAGFSVDTTAPALTSSGTASVPMPVKWMYVLEDGRMVTPSSGSGNMATVPGASRDNPIVGRVAFWTDDETAKVNVNTASEGAYWDWPKAATYNEMQFAGNPPIAGEFNRIPGHPAMTSLSAVFPELDPGQRWSNVTTYRTKLSTILGLTPRVSYSDASSRGGTYPVETENYNYGPVGSLPPIPNTPLTLKSDRLFVAPDEMIFTWPNRARQASITPEMLQQRAFFLTSLSRAPETTLFETPRVSLWPVTWPYPSAHALLNNRQVAPANSMNPDSSKLADNPWMRAEERLLAYVSTLNQTRSNGGDKYYFQRQNPESPTDDYSKIRRNRELLAYLQRLTAKDIPGYGGSFTGKYGDAARDAILANSFDVVRTLVNQYTLQNDGKMLYSFTPIAFTKFLQANGTVKNDYVESGAFCPIPMKLNLGSGDILTLSEFPLLREAAMVFYGTKRLDPVPPDISGLTKTADINKKYSNPWNWQNLINLDSTNSYPIGARTTEMRAVLLLDFGPLRGSTHNNEPVFWVKVKAAEAISANGQNLGFDDAVTKMDFRAVAKGKDFPSYLLPLFQRNTDGSPSKVKSFNHGGVDSANYGLISVPVTVSPSATQFSFSGGVLNVEVYGIKDGNPDSDPTADSNLLLASFAVDFSKWNGMQGIPLIPEWNFNEFSSSVPQYFPNPNYQAFDSSKPTKWAALEIAPGYRSAVTTADPGLGGNLSVWSYSALFNTGTDGSIRTAPFSSLTTTYARKELQASGDTDDKAVECMTDYGRRLTFNFNTGITVTGYARNGTKNKLNSGDPNNAFFNGFPAITPYDTVLSMIADPRGPGGGDPRLAQKFQFARADDAVGPAARMLQVVAFSDYPRFNRQYHTLGWANQLQSATGYAVFENYGLLGKGIASSGTNGMAIVGAQANTTTKALGAIGSSAGWRDTDAVGVDSAIPQSLVPTTSSVGDWSSQPGYLPDGGAVQRADQDFQAFSAPAGFGMSYQTPFFRLLSTGQNGLDSSASKGYFSPNRQVPSPISLLGSIPTSLSKGWQTLLFSPNPATGSTHPGLAKPADYLFLDLYWMPVAEPYPISEEFSTAGKVNLNYQIVPFTYLKRKTALQALMKSTWITALNNTLARNYKAHDIVKNESNNQTRYQIDVDQTLDLFDRQVFDTGAVFRSAAQICEMWLVPQGRSSSNVEAFWNDKLLTSDTAREAPYSNLYSRVTTKSNTFTVHWRVQALRKLPAGDQTTWDESKDRVAADLRGATVIERYLDPNATDLPDYATDSQALPLSNYYKWRVVDEDFFQP